MPIKSLAVILFMATVSCTNNQSKTKEYKASSCIIIGNENSCDSVRLKDHHAICFVAKINNNQIKFDGKNYSRAEFERRLGEVVKYVPIPYIIIEKTHEVGQEEFENYALNISKKYKC